MSSTRSEVLGVLDDLTPSYPDFWPEGVSESPQPLLYESPVAIKSSKLFIKGYSTKWLGLDSSTLYFADKRASKKIRCLNLREIPCNLQYYTKLKSKMPFRLVLRHHNMFVSFFFKEEQIYEHWITILRPLCLMNDFASRYNKGSATARECLCKHFWARNKETEELVTVKVYNLQWESNKDDLLQNQLKRQIAFNEVQALRNIDHPNVVKLKEIHEINQKIIIVKEFVRGASLLNHIISKGRLPESETAHIMIILLQALRDLHKQKIFHRNLKPENIFIDYTPNGTQLKIVNFSFSCTSDASDDSSWHINTNLCGKCGTPGYMAPETLANKKSTMASDVFSLGVILYACLTGEALFKGSNAVDIINKNCNVIYEKTPKWYSLSENAKHLIVNMIEKKPTQRPSIDLILEHPFFFGIDSKHIKTHLTASVMFEEMYVPNEGGTSLEKVPFLEKNKSSNFPLSKAIQSLIVPVSYYHFSTTGFSSKPEFYIENIPKTETNGTSTTGNDMQESTAKEKRAWGRMMQLIPVATNKDLSTPGLSKEESSGQPTNDEDLELGPELELLQYEYDLPSEDEDKPHIIQQKKEIETVTPFSNSPFSPKAGPFLHGLLAQKHGSFLPTDRFSQKSDETMTTKIPGTPCFHDH